MKRSDDFKIMAPSTNPHICYIPKRLERKIKYAKDKTGLSVYRILSASAGFPLSNKENIHKFKQQLKELGYKTIGEWAVVLLEDMSNNKDGTIPTPYKKEQDK